MKQTLSLADYTDEMLALDALAAMDDGEWTEEHQQLADAAHADAFFSGLVLSGAEVKQLNGEITVLQSLVRAVEATTWDGITLNEVNGRNWFDVRVEVMA